MPEDDSQLQESDFIPYSTVTSLPPGPVLVLAPHPDDEVLGCGGAIMRHVQAGDAVEVVVATDSDYGHFPDGADAIAMRRRESAAAAEVLGYGQPAFWGLPDRHLQGSDGLVERIVRAIAARQVAVVYAPSWWEVHPDHRALAAAAVDAVRASPESLVLSMYEVGMPLHPNRLLDITDLQDRKKAAIECFASQLEVQRYDRHALALNTFRTYTLSGSIEAAEAFRVLTGSQLRQLPAQAARARPCPIFGVRFDP